MTLGHSVSGFSKLSALVCEWQEGPSPLVTRGRSASGYYLNIENIGWPKFFVNISMPEIVAQLEAL